MAAPASGNGNSWSPQINATAKGFRRASHTLIAAANVIRRAHRRL